MKTLLILCLALLVWSSSQGLAQTPSVGSSGNASLVSEDTVLKTLRPGHPRLTVLPEDLQRIQRSIDADPVAKQYYERLRAAGEKILLEPPIERVLIGPRLLDKSRRLVGRIYTLGLLYRLDPKSVWLDRAVKELRAAAAFSDWNPSHFLDVAEMTHGFAIGYDWFYDQLTPEDRALIRTAIVEKGLKPAEKIHRQGGWWSDSAFNWNNVCNGGITVGALAVADEEPALARYLVAQAVKKLPKALATYAPDGAWSEGPGYWSYATHYTVIAFAAMQSALGTDFDLSNYPGLAGAGMFRIAAAGPSGKFFNFADAGENTGDEPTLFWLARRYHQPVLALLARQAAARRASAEDLIWYDPQGTVEDLKKLPLDQRYLAADVVFLRSAWDRPDARFVGFKGGDNKANHSHLDLGCFVLDSGGQRWIMDLGGDNYNLDAYFGAKRWTYYRLNTHGQNTLLLDGLDQDPKAASAIIDFKSTPERGYAIADLTKAYGPAGALKVQRGIALTGQRARVLVQDEIKTRQPVEVVWTVHTRAQIEIRDNRAILSQADQKLSAVILEPKGATFTQEELNLLPPQESTKGIRKLQVRLAGKTAETRLAIVFSAEDLTGADMKVLPLAEWAQ